jgi:anti-sigma28 factor (negative regulator of flagellin synthesis)
MMKARKVAITHPDAPASGSARQEKHVESRADSIAQLKAQLMARSDGTARIALVEMLKTQVESGTYHLDSWSLAQNMQSTLFMRNFLGMGPQDLLAEKQE